MTVSGDGARSWVTDRGVVAGCATAILVAALDQFTQIQLTGAYAVGAIVAAMLTVARRTAAVGALAVLLALLSGTWHDNIGTREWVARAIMCLILAALGVVSAEIRDRREARLRRMTVIAEAAQQAVLRSMPSSMGAVGLAARYVSATEEAQIGGDLYEVANTPFGIRVIVGDSRGKGLDAVQTAASILGAFRQQAFTEPDLVTLARTIDDVLAKIVGEEDFVTAVLAQLDADEVQLVNCGHHPPLLISGGSMAPLQSVDPALPLGLGTEPELSRHSWGRSDRLLFFTDGLIEARDPAGRFFPVDDHVSTLVDVPIDAALDHLLVDLAEFGARRRADDIALVLAEHLGPVRAG